MKELFVVGTRRVLAVVCTAVLVLSCVGCANSADSGVMSATQPSPTGTTPAASPSNSDSAPTVEQLQECEALTTAFLTEMYSVKDHTIYEEWRGKMNEALQGDVQSKREEAFSEYENRFRLMTTEKCLETLAANTDYLRADGYGADNGYLFKVGDIKLTVDFEDEDTIQYVYAAEITAVSEQGLPDTALTAEGRVVLEKGADGSFLVNAFDPYDRSIYIKNLQPKPSEYAVACESIVMEQLVNVDSGADFSTVDKVFAQADMVLRGRVTAISIAKYEEGSSLPQTQVTFGCEEVLKGISPVPMTFSVSGGVLPMTDYIENDKTAQKTLGDSDLTKEQKANGFLRVTVGKRIPLTEGEDYIVFLGKNADGSLYITGLDYGALLVKDGIVTDFAGKTYSKIG